MLWGSGVTLGPGRRLFPSTCSHISFALPDPIQGQSATSLHTDDLFYTATACGCLVFIQPGLLQEPEVCADPLHPSLRFAAMGVTVPKSVFQCNRKRYVRFDFNYLSVYVVRFGRKKTARRRFCGGAGCQPLWASCDVPFAAFAIRSRYVVMSSSLSVMNKSPTVESRSMLLLACSAPLPWTTK